MSPRRRTTVLGTMAEYRRRFFPSRDRSMILGAEAPVYAVDLITGWADEKAARVLGTSRADERGRSVRETGLERYLADILDTVAEGVAMIGPDGRYSFANLAAERMFGSREEIVGRRCDDLAWKLTTPEGEDLSQEDMPQSEVLRTGEAVLDRLLGALLPDGRRLMLSVDAVPFRGEGDRPVGTLVSFADVTQRCRVRRLDEALIGIGAAVNSSFDFDTILQRALDLAVEALGCESAILFMKEGSDWVMRHVTNLPEEMRGLRVADAEASFTTLTGGKAGAIAFNDAPSDDRIDSRVMRRFRIMSLLDVTLRVRGRDIGDVSFIYNSMAVSFNEDDVAFADRFGAVVGLALEGGELYRNAQETGRILQDALLGHPAAIEGIEFSHAYRSGTESAQVGGDFYDVCEIDEDHVAVVIGDVAGKGVPKAMTAALVKQTLAAFLIEGGLPAAVVGHANRVAQRSTDVSTFITAFVGLLDKRTGILDYCNAGGSNPLILRRAGDVERLTNRSPLLGAFAGAQFWPARASLAVGDVLLLCTNGVTEARGADGPFGEARLIPLIERSAHVGVKDLADHVMRAVSEYATVGPTDDVAIVAVERLEYKAAT
jgi:PAS domain S-box-containing protein